MKPTSIKSGGFKLKPISIKRIGNKLAVYLDNGKFVESSILPYGVNGAVLFKGICEVEGVTCYCTNGGSKFNVNGEEVYVSDRYITTLAEIKEFIINIIKPIIEKAMIIHEEIEIL